MRAFITVLVLSGLRIFVTSQPCVEHVQCATQTQDRFTAAMDTTSQCKALDEGLECMRKATCPPDQTVGLDEAIAFAQKELYDMGCMPSTTPGGRGGRGGSGGKTRWLVGDGLGWYHNDCAYLTPYRAGKCHSPVPSCRRAVFQTYDRAARFTSSDWLLFLGIFFGVGSNFIFNVLQRMRDLT